MDRRLQILISVIAVLIGILIVGLIAETALTMTYQSEAIECSQWAGEAAEYPGYYITQWQKSECDAHNIIIKAPIK